MTGSASTTSPIDHEIVAAASGWLEELSKAHPELVDRFFEADDAEWIAAAWAVPDGWVICAPCPSSTKSESAED
ncbi:MAG: hypothetical protein AAGG07_07955 [Planctomycetota bacterium]